jgi:hypothetical protein
MLRNGDEDNATLRFDDKSNANNSEESSKTRASIDTKLEDLTKRLDKLMTKNNKLRGRVKAKRIEGGSSSSKKKTPHMKEDSKKGKK